MKWLAIFLTAMFTGAKLANAISWSWWLVFSPVLIYYGFWIAFWVVMAIISLTWSFIDGFKEEWKKHESSKRKH